MSNSSVKRKAFTNGVIGFYTGKMQSVQDCPRADHVVGSFLLLTICQRFTMLFLFLLRCHLVT